MKTTYFLIEHSRGNHSAAQVYNHGKSVFSGTKTDCKKELIRMRKFCKEKFYRTSTNDKLTDFVNYEMADIFFVKKDKNGSIEIAN